MENFIKVRRIRKDFIVPWKPNTEKLILKYQTFEKTQDNKTSEAKLSSEELSWKTKNPEEIQVTNE